MDGWTDGRTHTRVNEDQCLVHDYTTGPCGATTGLGALDSYSSGHSRHSRTAYAPSRPGQVDSHSRALTSSRVQAQESCAVQYGELSPAT